MPDHEGGKFNPAHPIQFDQFFSIAAILPEQARRQD
jgi:hypothetical protein